jgi:hypothetical protein
MAGSGSGLIRPMFSNPLVGEALAETMGAAGAGVSLCAGRNLYSLTN